MMCGGVLRTRESGVRRMRTGLWRVRSGECEGPEMGIVKDEKRVGRMRGGV